ncbi:hypothetical protein B9Z55_026200 [Caenorhabditis nigoni]|uniref:Uncharacterized protein n=1 Tax=Caenorhabditis nigoni TaxID=1611254 RepID=A0A2G5T2A0_9PELO|nr:hypothetical protein B9Z55_026200 [Caenorhabditis nigoni]
MKKKKKKGKKQGRQRTSWSKSVPNHENNEFGALHERVFNSEVTVTTEINTMLPSKANDNKNMRKQTSIAEGSSSISPTLPAGGMRDGIQQAYQCQSVTYRRGEHHYSKKTLTARVQEKRKEVASGQKSLDLNIIRAHLAKIEQKGKAGSESGNVPRTAPVNSTGNGPQAPDDSTRPSMLIGSSSNPNPSEAAATGNQVTSPACRGNTNRHATDGNRSPSQSQRAAPTPNAPAPCFNFTPTDATVGKNAGENVSIYTPSYRNEIEYDAPQAPATYSNSPLSTSPNHIDESIERIVRGEETRVTRVRRRYRRWIPRQHQIENVPQTLPKPQVFTLRRDVPAEKGTATSSNIAPSDELQTYVPSENNQLDARVIEERGSGSRTDTSELRSSTNRMGESVDRNAHLLRNVEDSSAMNAPVGIYDDFSQASTSSLSNSFATDGVTHGATLSIPPPPRMIESIMKKVSNEMKNREESGSLDFGPIQVKLTATGKELDDTIAFLNNLKAQLESAKQGASFQQL